MAIKPFDSKAGFSIDDGKIHILITQGAPSGTGDFATAPIGSFALDAEAGKNYQKVTNNGNGADWMAGATKQDIDNIMAGDWRPHVKVADLDSPTLPTGTAGADIVVNGITVTDKERVLFALVGNVYWWDKPNGAWVEDTNLETAGDRVFSVHGTNGMQGLPTGGKTFIFTASSTWVLDNQPDINEQGFIHAFIGKLLDGGELPQYTSNLFIADNDNLVAALSKLDAALAKSRRETSALNVTAITTVDAVSVDSVKRVIWNLHITGVGLKANQVVTKTIDATHNGTTTTDATAADDTEVGNGRIGTLIGLNISVDLSGSGISQMMRLRVESTDAVNVTCIGVVI